LPGRRVVSGEQQEVFGLVYGLEQRAQGGQSGVVWRGEGGLAGWDGGLGNRFG